MRSSIVFAVLVGLLGTSNLFAQETDSQRRLTEMQETITRLSAELNELKMQQAEALPEPILVEPIIGESVLNTGPSSTADYRYPEQRGFSNQFANPYPNPPSPTPYGATYQAAPFQSLPPAGYPGANYGYPPTYIQTPGVYEHMSPYHRPPVFVDPGYGAGFGGPSVYVGPGGWGLDIGGLQLNFRGGHHNHSHGSGGGGKGKGRGHRH